MQHTIVMAFRKRLKRLGYTYISIHKRILKDGVFYSVHAKEPLASVDIECLLSLVDLYNKARI